MLKYVLIAVGGGLGSVLRYWMHGWVQRVTGVDYPWGTFAVNVTGCLLIGCLAAAFGAHSQVREEYRLGLTVGVLGGFTTFSTFGLETFRLAEMGSLGLALLNMAASCGAGLLAVAIGYWMIARLG